MKLAIVGETSFAGDAAVVASRLSAPNELVLLLDSGDVVRTNINDGTTRRLFSIQTDIKHGSRFDISAECTIYVLDSVVVVVNDFKQHGFVHYPGKYDSLRLWREDYHADISRYPIALYANEAGVPHIIYGVAWNQIQIMNLDTRQVLTASKSLIKENAEEQHLEFYKNRPESNKLPWPRPYDYFFGALQMSPNNERFLSAGWAWGSCDSYVAYDVDDFVSSHRISEKHIGTWEHCTRAVCWVDDETVAVAYDPNEEDEEGATKESPQELHFYRMKNGEFEFDKKVAVGVFDLVRSEINFNRESELFVVVLEKGGVALLRTDGTKLFHEPDVSDLQYRAELDLFLKNDGNKLTIYRVQPG